MAVAPGGARLAVLGPTLVTNDRKETWGEDVFGPDLVNDFVLEAIDEHAAADPATRITSVRNGQQIRGGKGRSLQSGSHVPFLAWWPDTIPSGHVNETLVDVGDMFPTLVEAAGAGPPPNLELDGESLLPTLRGRAGPRPRRPVHPLRATLVCRTAGALRLRRALQTLRRRAPVRPGRGPERTVAARRRQPRAR